MQALFNQVPAVVKLAPPCFLICISTFSQSQLREAKYTSL
jgi:hypothetical protein